MAHALHLLFTFSSSPSQLQNYNSVLRRRIKKYTWIYHHLPKADDQRIHTIRATMEEWSRKRKNNTSSKNNTKHDSWLIPYICTIKKRVMCFISGAQRVKERCRYTFSTYFLTNNIMRSINIPNTLWLLLIMVTE